MSRHYEASTCLAHSARFGLQIAEPSLATIGPHASATAARHIGRQLRKRQMKVLARLRSISGLYATGSGLE